MTGGKHFIVQITPEQVTPTLKSLFNPSDPASLRCFSVLDGETLGRIYTDRPQNPTWGVVQEAGFGSLYLGGQVHYPTLRRLMSYLRKHGDLLVGMWPDDPRWKLMPQIRDYTGFTLDFSDHLPGSAKEPSPSLPAGCKLQRMDLSLFENCAGKSLYLSQYGSAHQALKKGFGMCLTNHHELLCEAFAGPTAQGNIEIGTETHVAHRRKSYATLTCAQLIAEMEQRGYRTYWNCAADNQASIALARKLGYTTERKYRLQAWFLKAD